MSKNKRWDILTSLKNKRNNAVAGKRTGHSYSGLSTSQDDKLSLCQHELEEAIKKKREYYSAGIVQDRQVLVSSKTQDPTVDFGIFAGDIKVIFNLFEDRLKGLGECFENIATFPQKTILIRKLNKQTDYQPDHFWLIVIMNPTHRYFRQFINKLSKKLSEILFNSNRDQ